MGTTLLKVAAIALAASAAFAASGASAQVAGVKTIVITNANPNTDSNEKYLQIGDVSALAAVTFANVAHAINGATATASSIYDPSPNGIGGQVSGPGNAIDETYSGNYYGTPGIFHSGNSNTEFLRIDLANVSDLRNLSITGRDSFQSRDNFTYTLLNADGAVLKTGNLNNTAYAQAGKPNLVSFVPEPATWAMLILGFGVVGGTMRRRKAVATPAFA